MRIGPRPFVARTTAATVAFVLAFTTCATSALAIETGSPPQLPPPPPPPGGTAPSSPPPKATSKAATPPPPPPASASASASAPSSSVGQTSGDSMGGALDTRWALAGMLGISTDCLGFGLGVRGGKTFDNHLYVGGSFVYHFMSCGVGSYNQYGNNVSVSASTFYFGPEGGYDFDLKPVVLRVYMGVGPAFYNASVSGNGQTASYSTNEFVVWPGASVLWDVPSSPWFIGGDIRFVSVWNGPAVGFFLFGGLHFGS